MIYKGFLILLYIMFLLFLMFQLFTFIGFCFLVFVLHKLKLAGACRAGEFLPQLVRTGTLGTKEHYPFFRLFSWGYIVPVSKPKKNIRNISTVFRLPTLKVTYWEYQLMGLYSDNGTVTYWEYVTVTYSDYQLGKGDIL